MRDRFWQDFKSIFRLIVVSVILSISLGILKYFINPYAHCFCAGLGFILFVFYSYSVLYNDCSESFRSFENELNDTKDLADLKKIEKLDTKFSNVKSTVFNLFYIIYFTVNGFAQLYQSHGIIDSTGKLYYDSFNCHYFSIVTLTTLGFGDFRPTDPSKILVCFESMLGIIIFGLIIVLYGRKEELRIKLQDCTDKVIHSFVEVEVEKQLDTIVKKFNEELKNKENEKRIT